MILHVVFHYCEHFFEGSIEYSINLNISVKWANQRNKYEYDMINNNRVDYAFYFAKNCGMNRQLLFLNIINKIQL